MRKVILGADGDVVSEVYVKDDTVENLLLPDNVVGFNTKQNCDPVLADVQLARDTHGGEGQEGMKLAMRLPVAFVDHLIRTGRWNDPEELRKIVNDPELRAFRVWGGTL